METVINWIGNSNDETRVFCSTDDPALIRFFRKKVGSFLMDVKIIAEPEHNDNCLYFSVPLSYGKRAFKHLFPMYRKPMSEDRRKEVSDRFAEYRAAKSRVEDECDD